MRVVVATRFIIDRPITFVKGCVREPRPALRSQTAAAAIIAITLHSPIGEGERATGG
jgi:hypothetical protein